jgi:hypothetical protein
MTQEQNNSLIQHFQNNLTEAETILAKLEDKMICLEESLKRDRENGDWISYGEDHDRLGDLLRDHRLWTGRKNSYIHVLAAAKCYETSNVEG